MTSREIPPTPHIDDAEFKNRMNSEYKILQEKIDKIGGFRFTIKGWSVTAVIAASAAGTTSRSVPTAIVISISLSVMLLFFLWFEFEQVRLSRLFGNRALKLEDYFWRSDFDTVEWRGPDLRVPYIAHEILQSSLLRRIRRGKRVQLRERVSNLRRKWFRNWQLLRQAHVYFYVVLIIISFLPPLLSQANANRRSLHNLKHKMPHWEPLMVDYHSKSKRIPTC